MLVVFSEGEGLDVMAIYVVKEASHYRLKSALDFILTIPCFEADHGDESELQGGDGNRKEYDLSR